MRRLDELYWGNSNSYQVAEIGFRRSFLFFRELQAYSTEPDTIIIRTNGRYSIHAGLADTWDDLDPLTAQAVFYDLERWFTPLE